MDPRRPAWLEAGLFLVLVAVPLAFLPLSFAPFVDPKLLLLALGALLVWFSGSRANRRLAVTGGIWVGLLGVAAIAGVDPAVSLSGSSRQGTGVLLLSVCAFLLAVGANLPAVVVERLPRWLVGTAATASMILVAFRIVPGAFEAGIPNLSFWGSTLGNPVFAAALGAVGVAALLGIRDLSRTRLLALAAVLGAGLAANGERSALLLPLVAIALTAWRGRVPARRTIVVVAALVAVLGAWLALERVLPEPTIGRAAAQLQTLSGERIRLAVLSADLRGFTRRPVLGWGPGNTWSAYVSSATPGELRIAGRGWGDAHNLVVESLVASGVLGTAALLVLVGLVALPAGRAPSDRGWAVGAVATLVVFHLGQPVSVSLTPMLFLLAGIAAGPRLGGVRSPAGDAPRTSTGRLARAAAGVGLALALVVAGQTLTASVLERWARGHFAPWAYRASLTVQPWRLSAKQGLAVERALDARAREEGAAREARELARRSVRDHPWDPGARLLAADVHLLLDDFPGFRRWLREHLERFPKDTIEVPSEPPSATIPG